MLAELVKAGKLPPVEQRLPEPADLMVIKPLKEIGKYGGRWRRGFTGPADNENGNRIVLHGQVPDVGLHRQQSDARPSPRTGGSATMARSASLFLRKGLKWSDGQPFTADDFLFWYEEIYQNKDLVPTPIPELQVNGKPGRISKRDDYTRGLRVPRAVLPLRGHPGRRHADRRRTGDGNGARDFHGGLRAGPLPQAVPPQVLLGGRGHAQGQGRRLRQLGELLPQPHQLGAQRRAARRSAPGRR